MEFLNEKFWEITIKNWILFGVFMTIGILLKRYISRFLTTVVYGFLNKYINSFSANKFKSLLTKPISGLIANIFFFLAIVRLLPKIDTVKVIPALNRATVEDLSISPTKAITLFDIAQHVLYVTFIYYGFLLIIKIIEFILELRYQRAHEQKDRSVQQVIPLIKDILKVLLWGMALIVTLGVVFHINVAALIAGLGVGGVAIAFAAKESLENLIASFMVLVDKPFTIGDWIKVGNTEGIIEKVGFRSSRLRTFDRSIIIIPNRRLIDSEVENYSQRGIRRVKQTIGAIYGYNQVTLTKVMDEMEQAIQAVPGVKGLVTANLDSFGDSQINIDVVYFIEVKQEIDFAKVKEQVNFIIYELMYKHCGGFAYPTTVQFTGDEVNEVVPEKNAQS